MRKVPLRYFDAIACEYDVLRGAKTGRDLEKYVMEWARLGKDARLLDVGCGTGRWIAPLCQRCSELCICGLDLSTGMLSQAKKRIQSTGQELDVTLVRGDAEDLPFSDGVFDTVILFWVLQVVEDKSRTLSEISRVLRLGGRLLALVITHESLEKSPWGLWFPRFKEIDQNRVLTNAQLRSLMNSCNLHVVLEEGTQEHWVLSPEFIERICIKARSRYLSTFGYYSDKELEVATEVFREELSDLLASGQGHLAWDYFYIVGEKMKAS